MSGAEVTNLTEDDLAIVREEEALLDAVRRALRLARTSGAVDTAPIHGRLRHLRDEAARASVSDLPAIFDQLHSHQALAAHRFGQTLPDERSPYFARMRLREGSAARDVLLGHASFIDPHGGVTVIDWRHAPVSRIFYNYRQGDEYEEKLPGRTATGVVEVRRVVTIEDGRLIRITMADGALVRDGGDVWRREGPRALPRLAGGQGSAERGRTVGGFGAGRFGTGQSGRSLAQVAALLDREQFALLEADDDASLLVLGGAGCGKTTVALHRLAALAYRDRKRFAQKKMLVVVPERGLVRLSQKLLAGLGMTEVRVTTFDDWIRGQARMLCRDLPRRICESTPARVMRFKRHGAVLTVLDDFVRRRETEISERLRRKLIDAPRVADDFAHARGPNPAAKLIHVERRWRESREDEPYDANREILAAEVRRVLAAERDRLEALDADRIDLFSDRAILARIVAESNGDLTPGMIDEVLAHTRLQAMDTEEVRYADIDGERLKTVDGRSLDDGTPEAKAGSIDVEDYAILLELLRRKTGRTQTSAGRLHTYAHLVVDEAQDLAPVELRVLGEALRDGASVTIAGDAAQQIDVSSCFESWERVLRLLGVESDARAHHLTTSYRSARPIALYAHDILGPLAPAEPPRTVRDGAPVQRSDFPNEGHTTVFLAEALADLMDREGAASVAVIARRASTAARVADALRSVPKVRRVVAGEFPFTPGIDVTDVHQVKGLEWDYVIIPDANANDYPDTPESRRLLHVAATRAIHQLWLISVGKPSPLLPGE